MVISDRLEQQQYKCHMREKEQSPTLQVTRVQGTGKVHQGGSDGKGPQGCFHFSWEEPGQGDPRVVSGEARLRVPVSWFMAQGFLYGANCHK